MAYLSDGARWKGMIGEALADLIEDIEYAPKGTATQWFTERGDSPGLHGVRKWEPFKVDTAQFKLHANGDISGLWAPGIRTVEKVSSHAAKLDGSTLEFVGRRVFAADENRLVTWTPWGDDAVQVAIHWVER